MTLPKSGIELLLDLREALNSAVMVTFPVLMLVLARYMYQEFAYANMSFICPPLNDKWYSKIGWCYWCYCTYHWFRHVYRTVDWSVKASLGWFTLLLADLMRSIVAFIILHWERAEANYATHVVVIIISLFLLTVGAACIIRQLTPPSWGKYLPKWRGRQIPGEHVLWVPTVAVTIIAVVVVLFTSWSG